MNKGLKQELLSYIFRPPSFRCMACGLNHPAYCKCETPSVDVYERASAALDRIAEEARKETREADIAAVQALGLDGDDDPHAGSMAIEAIRSLGRTPSEGERWSCGCRKDQIEESHRGHCI